MPTLAYDFPTSSSQPCLGVPVADFDPLNLRNETCRRDLINCMWTAARRGRVSAIRRLEQRMTDGAEGRNGVARHEGVVRGRRTGSR